MARSGNDRCGAAPARAARMAVAALVLLWPHLALGQAENDAAPILSIVVEAERSAADAAWRARALEHTLARDLAETTGLTVVTGQAAASSADIAIRTTLLRDRLRYRVFPLSRPLSGPLSGTPPGPAPSTATLTTRGEIALADVDRGQLAQLLRRQIEPLLDPSHSDAASPAESLATSERTPVARSTAVVIAVLFGCA
ncbi:MAG: hypothetical protein AAGC55_32930, partial [Myxococcota bacterium]